MHSIQSSTVIPFPYHNQMEWSMPLNLVEYTGFDHLHHIFRYILSNKITQKSLTDYI